MRRLIELLRPSAGSGAHARLRAGVVSLGVLVLAAFTASSAYDTWRSDRNAVLSANRELTNLASALAEQTAWTWLGPDLLLERLAAWYPANARLPPGEIDQTLEAAVSFAPQVRSVRIIDRRGSILYASDNAARLGTDVSDRSYFKAQKDRTADGLFISEPLTFRSERGTGVVLSRKLVDDQGRFAGVVSAIIDLDYLSRLYTAVNLRGRIAIQLLRDDGMLLDRRPAVPTLVGHRFPTLASVRPGVGTSIVPSGAMIIDPGAAAIIRSPIDNDREMVAVARVRSMPLVLAVTRNADFALMTPRRETIDSAVRIFVLDLLGVLTIGMLVRQLRRLEQIELALRQSQKMEAIGTLAGGIAHDFNNILGAIVGYGELAQQHSPDGSSMRRYLDNVMQAAGRARVLVDRILGFSRSGLAERVPVDMQRVVAETLELLQASLPPNIRLEKALAAPEAAVIGDETRLQQVTLNLCTNALQAMPEGGVLRVALERVGLPVPRTLSRQVLPAGSYLRLTVADTGTGIRPEILGRIFDPFFTTKRVGAGTGLGLSLVHGIVADFGGAIDVSSTVGESTTFHIWLPESAEAAHPVAGESRDLPRGDGETIMIVDDEPALVSLMEETLAELGYEPVGFGSSSAALDAFRRDPDRFDAILSDELMPDLLGTQLARELKRLRPDIPIVLMSGHGGGDLAERAAAAGVSEVLRKPLQKRDLAEALAKRLAKSAIRTSAD